MGRRVGEPVEVKVVPVYDGPVYDGRVPVGSAHDGRVPVGSAHDGRAPVGSAHDGRAPDGSAQGEPACRPSAFIWRSRLYVVREVLSHWSERRAWWHEALDAREADAAPGAALEQAARESEVWRVEASPGWSFRPGVYELALVGAGAAVPGSWALVQVED